MEYPTSREVPDAVTMGARLSYVRLMNSGVGMRMPSCLSAWVSGWSVTVRRTAFLTTGLLSGGGRADLLSHGPWQQFADAIDGVVGDARNDVAQVGLGVEAVQLG